MSRVTHYLTFGLEDMFGSPWCDAPRSNNSPKTFDMDEVTCIDCLKAVYTLGESAAQRMRDISDGARHEWRDAKR